MLRASIPANIEIKENIHSRAKVMADPGKIHQVVMNLCTNAYQSMKNNCGSLYVELKEITIKKRKDFSGLTLIPGNYVCLKVKNNGQGINQKTVDKIFEPYFTTKEEKNGTGIGLAIVHRIVEEHKGYIEVDTHKDKGSSFNVFFPVIPEKTVSDFPKKENKMLVRGSETILLVDDDKNVLDTTGKLLEYYGYKVNSFSNVMAAFQNFKKDPLKFDIIISDMAMPEMTGLSFSKKVLELRPDTPIILCSGFNANIVEKQLMDIGIRKFLQKPVISHELISQIQTILYA